MEFIITAIAEFFVGILFHFCGLFIRWVCFRGKKSFEQLEKNDHWNTMIGVLFLIGLILVITLFFVL